jgi:hypothetical protein
MIGIDLINELIRCLIENTFIVESVASPVVINKVSDKTLSG